MRFDRRPKIEGYQWTPRKQAAYLRRQERLVERVERDYPLFAEEFAPVPALELDEEKTRREQMMFDGEQSMRDLAARHWRKGRRAYFACSAEVRVAIMDEWRRWAGPAEAGYFIYVVEKHNGVQQEKSARRESEQEELRRRIAAQLGAQGTLLK